MMILSTRRISWGFFLSLAVLDAESFVSICRCGGTTRPRCTRHDRPSLEVGKRSYSSRLTLKILGNTKRNGWRSIAMFARPRLNRWHWVSRRGICASILLLPRLDVAGSIKEKHHDRRIHPHAYVRWFALLLGTKSIVRKGFCIPSAAISKMSQPNLIQLRLLRSRCFPHESRGESGCGCLYSCGVHP